LRKINLKKFTVATSVTARDINRRIILNVVRSRQPISRADVARHTGLQRSTELIEEGWIVEGAMGRLPRGRRPIFLQLNAERARIIGVNVRPLKTNIALSDLNGHYLAQESFDTPREPKEFISEIIDRIKAMVKTSPDNVSYEGIGISVPGRVDNVSQRLVFAPNLGWRDLDMRTPVEKALKIPVELENAANACALAENYFGQHTDGVENLVAVTVSEGIGTGIIVNGQLVRGASGKAGEFGHTTINPDGPVCSCGNRGCWEVFASNSAALRRYAAAAKGSNGSKGKAKEITFEEFLRLAEGGDARAAETLDEMAKYLGMGLANLVNGIQPNLIIVVGEVTRSWARIGPIIDKEVKARCTAEVETRIMPVDDALQPRLRGTIALVMEKHFGAPPVA
jgi:predicted NBD/HSP70 family sugar kinase